MSKKLLFATIASILTLNAFADQVVTSRAYVDNADAQKVNIAQGVGTNNANVGKTLIVNSSGNLELGTVSGDNFIEDSITDGVTNKAPSENAVYDALADKQDTIETGLVEFHDGVADLPAIVTYDSTDGVTGNKIGILDFDTIDDDEGVLSVYNGENGYGSEMDNYVPTVRAVAEELGNIWNAIPSVPPLTWNSTTDTAAVNNYSTTFNGTTNNWPTAQSGQYVQGAVLANGLALKQNKIPASEWENGHLDTIPGVVVSTDSDGVVEQRMILDKTQDITDRSIDYVVSLGYDDDQHPAIVNDIHSNSVSANDVNYAVPTTTMTIAIAKSAASQAVTPLTWNSTTDTAAVNNYSTTFNSTTNNWPTAQSTQYIQGAVLANALALKQNTIPAQATKINNSDSTFAPSVVTNTASTGVVGQMAILTSLRMNQDNFAFDDYTSNDNLIPTVGAAGKIAEDVASTKQDKLGGSSSNAGKVVTATATAGNVTYTAIDGTVTNASNNLVTSGAVYTAVSTKQNKMTCTRWLNNIETDENCLLWSIE